MHNSKIQGKFLINFRYFKEFFSAETFGLFLDFKSDFLRHPCFPQWPLAALQPELVYKELRHIIKSFYICKMFPQTNDAFTGKYKRKSALRFPMMMMSKTSHCCLSSDRDFSILRV